MNDIQQQIQMHQGRPNYYNQNNLQANPLNNQQNPYVAPKAPYQPQPFYPPPPSPASMQAYPLNSAQPIAVYQVVNAPAYPPCPFCRNSVPTVARRVVGQAQIFWCIILAVVFPFICCLPFCMQSCNDIHYECSSCRRMTSVRIRPICNW